MMQLRATRVAFGVADASPQAGVAIWEKLLPGCRFISFSPHIAEQYAGRSQLASLPPPEVRLCGGLHRSCARPVQNGGAKIANAIAGKLHVGRTITSPSLVGESLWRNSEQGRSLFRIEQAICFERAH